MAGRDLVVTPSLTIPARELVARASRAGGPGGQHVNTSSTRVELTWSIADSAALTPEQRARLLTTLAGRIDGTGELRVVSAATRSQLQNREAARLRLAALIRAALVVPRTRRKTRPTAASKERRLADKRRRAGTKRERRKPGHDD